MQVRACVCSSVHMCVYVCVCALMPVCNDRTNQPPTRSASACVSSPAPARAGQWRPAPPLLGQAAALLEVRAGGGCERRALRRGGGPGGAVE
jgi:hypothetical protein